MDWLDNPFTKKIVSELPWKTVCGVVLIICSFPIDTEKLLAVPQGSKQFLLWELMLGLRSARNLLFSR